MASRTWRQRSSPKNSSGVPFENVPAEESTGKGQERLMDIDPLLITHTQPTKLVELSCRLLQIRPSFLFCGKDYAFLIFNKHSDKKGRGVLIGRPTFHSINVFNTIPSGYRGAKGA